MRDWKPRPSAGEDFTCPHCGADYKVRIKRLAEGNAGWDRTLLDRRSAGFVEPKCFRHFDDTHSRHERKKIGLI